MSFFAQRNIQRKLLGGNVEESEVQSFTGELWNWVKSTVAALLVVLFIHQFVFNLSTVKGSSMQPTLVEGEWLFVNKAASFIHILKPGDVVILKEPDKLQAVSHPFLVKRIVATAGDRVEINKGKLYVNGQEMSEPYTNTKIEDGDYGPHVVEQGHYFVMGDNRHRGGSYDSRSFGSIPAHLIQGRAEWIVWPFSKAAGL